jgi:hypothetical protein
MEGLLSFPSARPAATVEPAVVQQQGDVPVGERIRLYRMPAALSIWTAAPNCFRKLADQLHRRVHDAEEEWSRVVMGGAAAHPGG